jgi:hypothetical protein
MVKFPRLLVRYPLRPALFLQFIGVSQPLQPHAAAVLQPPSSVVIQEHVPK